MSSVLTVQGVRTVEALKDGATKCRHVKAKRVIFNVKWILQKKQNTKGDKMQNKKQEVTKLRDNT
jgi:hypothetical protein